MEQMGMTDKQFNGFIRFLIDDLKKPRKRKTPKRKTQGSRRYWKTSRALWKIKKEPYNNSSDTQERAELATALK